MSEEPRKRQRIEDGDICVPADPDSLRVKLEEKQNEILRLRRENQSLTEEIMRLNNHISKFQSGWAKHISDMQSLCQAYTLDDTYQFQPGCAFEALSKSDEAIPELSMLTKTCIRPLLIAIDKCKQGYSNDEIQKKISVLQDAYIKTSSQFSEYRSEIQQLKNQISKQNETIANKIAEIEELKTTKESLSVRLVKAAAALNCRCRCRCGARRTDFDEDFEDFKDLRVEINKLKDENSSLLSKLTENIERVTKMQLEMEVSEERFIRSRAFKSLVSQAKSIVKAMESLKKNNEELQKTNDEFNEAKFREIRSLMMKEEEKRGELEHQIRPLQSKLIAVEKERDEALTSLSLLKKEQVYQKTSSNYKYIIEDLEEEKSRLKKQVAEHLKEKADFSNKIDEEQRKVNELRDELVLKEIENSKLTQGNTRLDIPESELQIQLKEHRNEIIELKNQLKIKDSTISKQDSAIRQLKQDIKSEKRSNENLINEIEVTGNAYEETMKKNKSLASQLIDLEKNYIHMMNERAKESNWKALVDKQQSLLEEQIKTKESVINSLQELIKEEEKVSAARLETINSLENKFRILEQKYTHINTSHDESNKKYEKLLMCKKEIQDKLRDAEKICIKNATECVQYKFLYEHCEKTLRECEERASQTRDSLLLKNSHDIFMEEASKNRELVRCSQCKTRNRDCLLLKCLHLFCRRCIELNLSQKKRKCPCCFTKFTSEDVRTFYWN